MRLVETPVGFKYIGSVMREEGAFLGARKAGISIRGHIPEKTVLWPLYFCRDAGGDGSRAGELFRRLRKKIELLSFERLDIHTLPGKRKALRK